MTTTVRPLVETPRQRELRERRARVKVRARRVEREGLAACRVCGGAVEPVEDTSLRCDCTEQVARLVGRIRRLAYERRDSSDDLAHRIAP